MASLVSYPKVGGHPNEQRGDSSMGIGERSEDCIETKKTKT